MRKSIKRLFCTILLLTLVVSPVSAFAADTKSSGESSNSTHQIIDGYSYSNEVVYILDEINRFRRDMGLPEVKLDPVITEAAQNHADYLEKNDTTGHAELKGKPGFTGASHTERIKAVGGNKYLLDNQYFLPNEVISYHSLAEVISYSFLDRTVEYLIYLPYHRAPLVDYSTTVVGIGISDKAVVINSAAHRSRIYEDKRNSGNSQNGFTFPYDGQKNVPPVMLSEEIPNPLEGTKYKSHSEVGTIISIYVDPSEKFDPSLVSLSTKKGEKVDIVVVQDTRHTNHLSEGLEHWYILPPKLKGNTTYTVKAHGKEWSFTTRKGAWDFSGSTKEDDRKEGHIWVSPTEQKPLEELRKRTKFFNTNSKSGYVNVLVNGKEIVTNPRAHIVNGQTFIPLRGVFEALGAEVGWESIYRQVTIKYKDKIVILQIDNKEALVIQVESPTNPRAKETKVTLSNAPFVKNGTTFIPLRFVAESIGGEVIWYQEDYTASIIAEYNIED
jgi:hypothetical protein